LTNVAKAAEHNPKIFSKGMGLISELMSSS
jgi:hypothetical protein